MRPEALQRLALIARICLGLIFFIFGINGYLKLIPLPTPTPEAAIYLKGLFGTNPYMFHIVKLTEIIVGLMLLANFYAPLGLIILAPVFINILLVHVFLDQSGLKLDIAMLAAYIILVRHFMPIYKKLLVRSI